MTNSTISLVQANIKRYRIEKNFTQEILSEKAGISCDYLSEIERGKRIPSLKRLCLIADALQIETYLLFKKEKK